MGVLDTMLNLQYHRGTAIVESHSGASMTYDDLREQGRAAVEPMGDRQLLVLFADMRTPTIVLYVGALLGGHAVALLDSRMKPHLKAGIVRAYLPAWIAGPVGLAQEMHGAGSAVREVIVTRGAELVRIGTCEGPRMAPELSLLLATSGTTGSVKFVRLSHRNIEANAASIVNYLELTEAERPIASMPFHYSYGLSVLNSHLLAGAALVLTEESVVQPGFWGAFRENGCTSFAGVPFSYSILERIGFRDMELPSLRTMTQAGGPLSTSLVELYSEHMRTRKGRFFVMYGQTEATARMAYLPPDRVGPKLGSVGIPVRGGQLLIDNGVGLGNRAGEVGEVVYRGPNVMLGYADGAEDLSRGDDVGGELRTGDLGYLDEDGFLFLVGRSKRIAKVFGVRVNLDDVELKLRERGPAAAIEGPDVILVACAFGDQAELDGICRALTSEFGLSHRSITLRRVGELPMTSSGKVDYTEVERWLST